MRWWEAGSRRGVRIVSVPGGARSRRGVGVVPVWGEAGSRWGVGIDSVPGDGGSRRGVRVVSLWGVAGSRRGVGVVTQVLLRESR